MTNSEKNPQSWWTTVPGTITAIAGLVTAIGGLLLTLKSVGFFDKPGSVVTKDTEAIVIDTTKKKEVPKDLDPNKTANSDCSLPDRINGYTYLGTLEYHKYFLSDDSVTWTEANSRATKLGGHLLTLSNSRESDFITNTTNIQAWIGFTNILTGDRYQWNTGETVKYTNWSDGEPNNAGNEEHYAIINWYKGTWNDMAGSQIHCFIIEFQCPE